MNDDGPTDGASAASEKPSNVPPRGCLLGCGGILGVFVLLGAWVWWSSADDEPTAREVCVREVGREAAERGVSVREAVDEFC